MKYKWEMNGTAAKEQTWTASGVVYGDRPGDFPITIQKAVMMAFEQLTKGKAVYGKPGVGCQGPYGIDKIVLERVEDDAT